MNVKPLLGHQFLLAFAGDAESFIKTFCEVQCGKVEEITEELSRKRLNLDCGATRSCSLFLFFLS